jgi:hypothetical protein
LTARLLDFAPSAWQAYQSLRAAETGGLLKQALLQLADDPTLVRADPRSSRYVIIEKQLRQAPQVWGLFIDAPDGARWLVAWREIGAVIEIGYLGPAPSTPEASLSGPEPDLPQPGLRSRRRLWCVARAPYRPSPAVACA